jgi:hypothetical protein
MNPIIKLLGNTFIEQFTDFLFLYHCESLNSKDIFECITSILKDNNIIADLYFDRNENIIINVFFLEEE